jgi:hypothetical protein
MILINRTQTKINEKNTKNSSMNKINKFKSYVLFSNQYNETWRIL